MTMTSVSVPGTALGARQVVRAFDEFRESEAIAGPSAQAVQVALDEVLSNIVRSGFGADRIGRIDVRFEMVDGVLDILVVDDGVAFDPLARADPDTHASLEARPVGGLGIYLVRHLMDSAEYERRDEENRLRLRKRIIKD
jgi:serine/threonine-protein kinase RsbW